MPILFPVVEFNYKSTLNYLSTNNKIQEELDKTDSWIPFTNQLYFKGTSFRNKFKLQRIIGYRNSFNPVIEIEANEESSEQTNINILCRLNYIVMFIWLIICTITLFGLSIYLVREESLDFKVVLVFILFLTINYLSCILSFAYQVKKIIKHFQLLFKI